MARCRCQLCSFQAPNPAGFHPFDRLQSTSHTVTSTGIPSTCLPGHRDICHQEAGLDNEHVPDGQFRTSGNLKLKKSHSLSQSVVCNLETGCSAENSTASMLRSGYGSGGNGCGSLPCSPAASPTTKLGQAGNSHGSNVHSDTKDLFLSFFLFNLLSVFPCNLFL